MFFRDLCIRVSGIGGSLLFFNANITPRRYEPAQAGPGTVGHGQKNRYAIRAKRASTSA